VDPDPVPDDPDEPLAPGDESPLLQAAESTRAAAVAATPKDEIRSFMN